MIIYSEGGKGAKQIHLYISNPSHMPNISINNMNESLNTLCIDKLSLSPSLAKLSRVSLIFVSLSSWLASGPPVWTINLIIETLKQAFLQSYLGLAQLPQ